MTPELWEKVRDIFADAREVPMVRRAGYVAQACAGDRELRQEVEALLETADEIDESFIEEPLVPREPEPAIAQGDTLGAYEVQREIGRGGMGAVYEAVRADKAFTMRTAIKVIQRGSQGEEFSRRFRQERQILAGLDHPNIAKLLDGGATEDDRPYFVMEYVEGEHIDQYCDANQLGLRERVKLFLDVCSAVQYAHRNLVVHRDLKPGNILVTADGQPKLLDFGIAKLIESGPASSEATTRAHLTLPGSPPMTLLYASPEQLNCEPVTTACDVYSLGVLLYQILTGHIPYRVEHRTPVKLIRAIADQEPTKLSSIVGIAETVEFRNGDLIQTTPESVSLARNSDVRTLQRRLRGDLDSIVLKALAKEPELRYTSVEQLSEDLRRYLEGLPVSARVGTFIYRSSKFIQRNKIKLISILAVLVTVVAIVSMHQFQKGHERRLMASFTRLVELAQEPGSDLDSLAKSLREIEERYGDRSDFAKILDEQASVLEEHGDFQRAEFLYRQALEIWQRLFDDRDEAVVTGFNRLASVLQAQGKFSEAEPLYQKSLAIRESEFGRQSEEVALMLNNLAVLYQNSDRLDGAEPLIKESLQIRRALNPHSAVEASSHNNLAFLYVLQGEHQKAEESYLEALEIMQALGPELRAAQIQRNLAALYVEMGRFEEAEAFAREALELFYERHVHWQIADAESVLGECLLARGQVEEAERLLEWSYEAIARTRGENARQTLEAKKRRDKFRSRQGLAGSDLPANG